MLGRWEVKDDSDPPTFASPLPHALAPALYDGIVCSGTMGTYTTQAITVMSTHGKGCADPGMRGKAGDINPLDVVGFNPGLCFTAH